MRTGIIALLLCFFAASVNAQVSNEDVLKRIEDLEKQIEELKKNAELKDDDDDDDDDKEEKKEAEVKKIKEEKVTEEKKENKGKGKVILRGFVNFNSQTQGGETNVAFKLDRMYLGYEHSFDNGLKLKGVIDFGKPSATDDYNYLAYIKNAFVSWTRKGFTVSGGMIQTTQSSLQEIIWGKRYIMMVFHDQYKFGSSADLGFSLEYKFADWVKGDFIMVNGEGYKKIQNNKGFLYGLGFTFTPIENLFIRIYGDLNNSRLDGQSNIYGYSALMAYKSKKFTLSGEFNMMQNYKNVNNHDLLGCSVFGSVKAHKLIDVYARYDFITSNNDWNINSDKQTIVAGFEILPCKYVKISPNFRMEIPQNGGDNRYMAYLNCMFNL